MSEPSNLVAEQDSMRWNDGNVIHECDGARMVASDPGTYLVWTKCGVDVPANAAFYGVTPVTCKECAK